METIPPAEIPQPSQPAQPTAPPPEISPPGPDIDVPDAAPAGDPAPSQPSF